MNSFEELFAWQSAQELRISFSIIAKLFLAEEKFRLTDKIILSSRSIFANITEGFGRFNHQDNILFCRMARGSLYETLEHLICALDKKYISEKVVIEQKEIFATCLKILNGYIAYLKKAKLEKDSIIQRNLTT